MNHGNQSLLGITLCVRVCLPVLGLLSGIHPGAGGVALRLHFSGSWITWLDWANGIHGWEVKGQRQGQTRYFSLPSLTFCLESCLPQLLWFLCGLRHAVILTLVVAPAAGLGHGHFLSLSIQGGNSFLWLQVSGTASLSYIGLSALSSLG